MTLRVLNLGDSDRLRVADVVLAIGNSLGIGKTDTMGIIITKGRRTGLTTGSFEDFLHCAFRGESAAECFYSQPPVKPARFRPALINEQLRINSQIISVR
jgi:S1-C subfamily serine protease